MARRRDPVLLGVVALGVTVFLVSFFSGFSPQYKFLGTLGKISGALVSVLPVVELVWRERRPPDPRPAHTLVDSLALVVRAQWRKEATRRKLSPPEPIPVSWSLTDLAGAGPVETAVGDPDVAPAFRPLPGQTRITEEQLRAGGGRAELFGVYAGIASGRVVVVGAPGAGKTGSAILLVLDALDHRDHVDAEDRAKVPVPVLFTAHGWDPATCSVGDWLASQLAGTYPLLQHRGGQTEAAELIDAGAVALILDGLDQMDVAQRRDALRALGDASFRVVVFARSEEIVQAATWLVGAVGLHLHDVSNPEAADYLRRARTEPPPVGWTQLLTHLRENPDSAPTSAMSTPLALTLIRDTYQAGDDVSELLNITESGTRVDLEQHLVGRVLVDAYTSRPGRPKPRYSLSQAERALAFLARQMHHDHSRDLGWWHIPRWASTTPRILTSVITVGLLGGILGTILYALAPTGLSRTDRLLLGLMIGFGVGIPLGLEGGRGAREPKRVRTWRGISLRLILITGLAYGLAAGLLMLLVCLLTSPLVGPKWANPLAGAVAGILVGLSLVVWLMPRIARGSATRSADEQSSPQGPLESWRNDRVFGLVAGLAFGLAGGLGYGLGTGIGNVITQRPAQGQGPVDVLVSGLKSGPAFGLTMGLVYGITASATWATILAWRLQLQRSRHIPAVGLMSFLQDAQDRDVLRTVGAFYQFRHATLQDQLAGRTTASPGTSSAARRSS